MEELLLAAALDDSDEDDDFMEAAVLHILHDEDALGNRGVLYGRFNFEELLNLECKRLFRFSKIDIPRLTMALGIPEQIITEHRISVSGIESLCIVLRRLAYPNRLVDLEPIFGLSSSAISSVFNHTINLIIENKGHLLQNLGNVTFFNRNKLTQYSEAIMAKGSPIHNCWGFIDGTVRPICRPSVNQEIYYSGHKKTHCVKFQSVMCPDGIIISMIGPYEGRRHDAGILRESGLYDQLLQNTTFPNGNFVIYGDQAYGLRELLLRPYTQHEINGHPEREQFNQTMSNIRIAVEWGFGKIIQEFAFLDFKKNQKILLQDVGNMYKVGTILTNCHTCLYGGEISTYFNINPPTLEVYLGNN